MRWRLRATLALAAAGLAAAVASIVLSTGGGAEVAEPPPEPAPLPAPDARVPRDPARLAERLTATSRALQGSIDAWVLRGDPGRGSPPRAVTLQALYQQRAYRLLARRPRLAAATRRRLPRWLRPTARDVIGAHRELTRLSPPTRRVRRFRTARPRPAGVLLRWYRAAQRRFGVSWRVLAAVNMIESGFGRLRNDSTAGAQGPMQFIPSTWRAHGMGGDVHDPHDAILGAANYLRRSGAPRDYRRALYAYNPSRLYVSAVLRYARRMRSSRRAYFNLYAWQVFVRTPSGDVRLTGPGRRVG